MNNDVKAILERPFLKEDVKKDYSGFDYVDPHLVIRRLNEAFGQDGWQFVPEERMETDLDLIQFGKIGIKDDTEEWVWKHNCGGKRISYIKGTDKRVNPVNDYKSALSNCLKRCAMMLGVALDLYGPEEAEEGEPYEPPVKTQPQSQERRWADGDGRKPKASGSAEGGSKSDKSPELRAAMKKALELQKELLIATGLTQKELAEKLLGAGKSYIPNEVAAWETYCDLLLIEKDAIGKGIN